MLALAVSPSVAAAGIPCSLFGGQVRSGDADAFYPVLAAGGGPAFVDGNGNGAFNLGEDAYFDADGDLIVSTNDARLTGAPGSVVRPVDADFGFALVALPGSAAYFDANGDALYGAPDPVYWDTDSDGAASPADLRLTASTGGPAGSVVHPSDADFANLLAPLSASFTFFDADANALFGRPDGLYLSASSATTVQMGDVRLSGTPTALSAEPVVNLAAAPVGLVTPAFRATLTAGGTPVAGAAVAFYAGGSLLCSAPTDAAGMAACGTVVEKAVALAFGGYEARYAGSFPFCGTGAAGAIL
jgi:hypothetical protein